MIQKNHTTIKITQTLMASAFGKAQQFVVLRPKIFILFQAQIIKCEETKYAIKCFSMDYLSLQYPLLRK